MDVVPPRWTSQTKLTVSLLLLALGVYLLTRFSIVIAPMILAVILAYVLSPGVNSVQGYLHIPRSLAAVLVYLALLVLVVLIPVALIPTLGRQLTGLVLGLPFALAMAVLAGLLEFLPSIGHGIWLVTASILAISTGSTWLPLPNWAFMLIVIGLHLVFQQFDLNYLIPRIIGSRVHLPPLVVILGIVVGAALAGVLGVVLAAPTIASTRIVGRYLFANLFDLDPFSEVAEAPPPSPDSAWWRLKIGSRKRQTGVARESDQLQ